MEKVKYELGQVVEMKKPHPCGSKNWLIQRVGMDFGIKCEGCNHFVMIPRVKFEKAVKKIIKNPSIEENQYK